MKLTDIRNSRYLTKKDLDMPLIRTIDAVDVEEIEGGDVGTEEKAVLHWQESNTKPMVLNATNFETIVEVTGEADSDDWHGHKVQVYHDTSIQFRGKRTGGIRVRAAA
jgi:hypothetical protein